MAPAVFTLPTVIPVKGLSEANMRHLSRLIKSVYQSYRLSAVKILAVITPPVLPSMKTLNERGKVLSLKISLPRVTDFKHVNLLIALVLFPASLNMYSGKSLQ